MFFKDPSLCIGFAYWFLIEFKRENYGNIIFFIFIKFEKIENVLCCIYWSCSRVRRVSHWIIGYIRSVRLSIVGYIYIYICLFSFSRYDLHVVHWYIWVCRRWMVCWIERRQVSIRFWIAVVDLNQCECMSSWFLSSPAFYCAHFQWCLSVFWILQKPATWVSSSNVHGTRRVDWLWSNHTYYCKFLLDIFQNWHADQHFARGNMFRTLIYLNCSSALQHGCID